MRTQADWAYIKTYIEETEAIRQQTLESLNTERTRYTLPERAYKPRNAERNFLILQPGIINTYLAQQVSNRA
jgi:hypothetical protein